MKVVKKSIISLIVALGILSFLLIILSLTSVSASRQCAGSFDEFTIGLSPSNPPPPPPQMCTAPNFPPGCCMPYDIQCMNYHPQECVSTDTWIGTLTPGATGPLTASAWYHTDCLNDPLLDDDVAEEVMHVCIGGTCHDFSLPLDGSTFQSFGDVEAGKSYPVTVGPVMLPFFPVINAFIPSDTNCCGNGIAEGTNGEQCDLGKKCVASLLVGGSYSYLLEGIYIGDSCTGVITSGSTMPEECQASLVPPFVQGTPGEDYVATCTPNALGLGRCTADCKENFCGDKLINNEVRIKNGQIQKYPDNYRMKNALQDACDNGKYCIDGTDCTTDESLCSGKVNVLTGEADTDCKTRTFVIREGEKQSTGCSGDCSKPCVDSDEDGYDNCDPKVPFIGKQPDNIFQTKPEFGDNSLYDDKKPYDCDDGDPGVKGIDSLLVGGDYLDGKRLCDLDVDGAINDAAFLENYMGKNKRDCNDDPNDQKNELGGDCPVPDWYWTGHRFYGSSWEWRYPTWLGAYGGVFCTEDTNNNGIPDNAKCAYCQSPGVAGEVADDIDNDCMGHFQATNGDMLFEVKKTMANTWGVDFTTTGQNDIQVCLDYNSNWKVAKLPKGAIIDGAITLSEAGGTETLSPIEFTDGSFTTTGKIYPDFCTPLTSLNTLAGKPLNGHIEIVAVDIGNVKFYVGPLPKNEKGPVVKECYVSGYQGDGKNDLANGIDDRGNPLKSPFGGVDQFCQMVDDNVKIA